MKVAALVALSAVGLAAAGPVAEPRKQGMRRMKRGAGLQKLCNLDQPPFYYSDSQGGSTWAHEANQDWSVYNQCGSYSYSNDAQAEYHFTLSSNSHGFAIMGGKKLDRGMMYIYSVASDGTRQWIGSADAFCPTEGPNNLGTPSETLFSTQYDVTPGAKSFVVTNVARDSRIQGNAYLGVDAVQEFLA